MALTSQVWFRAPKNRRVNLGRINADVRIYMQNKYGAFTVPPTIIKHDSQERITPSIARRK